ncbi:hypothetical protein LSAT2_030042 [Lamellibrachia satsuma]|nr:hypothetical protein LSAT2_030042 [Lamellibrachia satsuma]
MLQGILATAPTTTTAASAVNLDSTSDASGTTPTHEHSTSDAPGTTPTHEHAGSCGRHFDVGSFFGGAALAAGIAVIIFFGCKFYKARSTPSYHQF